ncbi:MAG: translocation/assembly module TamB domain-containing protein [Paludibacteraceae bacterium]|nr:translocation/assembly module TamB domain-containing protein [Paludibacteraceae bacterium]
MLGIVLLLGLLIFLLQDSRIQTFVAQWATSRLSEQTGTTIRIGHVNYDFFNHICIDQVYIEDQSADTLAYIDNIDINFDLWGVLRNRYQIKNLDVNGLYANLHTDSAGQSNLQFLIDLFSDDDSPSKPFDALVEAQVVRLTDARVRLTDDRRPHTGGFDFYHLDIHDLNAELSLERLDPSAVDAAIHSLRLKESSGLQVSRLEAHLHADSTYAAIDRLILESGGSDFRVDQIRMDYAGLSSFDAARVTLALKGGSFNLRPIDLAALLPALRPVDKQISGQIEGSGTLDDIRLTQLNLQYADQTLLRAAAGVKHVMQPDSTSFRLDIDKLELSTATLTDLAGMWSDEPLLLPDPLSRLGSVSFKGSLSGRMNEGHLTGVAMSPLGSLSANLRLAADTTDGGLSFGGTASTHNFMLGRLLNSRSVDRLSVSTQLTGYVKDDKMRLGVVAHVDRLGWNGYDYHAIRVSGQLTDGRFDGLVASNDRNLNFDFRGTIDATQPLPAIDCRLNVAQADLKALHLSSDDLLVDMQADIHVNASDIDHMDGTAHIGRLHLQGLGDAYTLNDLHARVALDDTQSLIDIQSDLINAGVTGNYRISTLATTVQNMLARHIPDLIGSDVRRTSSHNKADFHVYIEHIDHLCNVLNLPVGLTDVATVKGSIDEDADLLDLRVSAPSLSISGMNFGTVTLGCDNLNNRLNLDAYVRQDADNHPLSGRLTLSAHNDTIHTLVNWTQTGTETNSGQLHALLTFMHAGSRPQIDIDILPTRLTIADSTWQMYPSNVRVNADRSVDVNGFLLAGREQYVSINGRVGPTVADSLSVDLKRINLDYLMQLVRFESLNFGGDITGAARLYALTGQMAFEADARVDNATMNNAKIGDVVAHAVWDRDLQRIGVTGQSVERNDTVALIDGFVSTRSDSVDFRFKANGFNLALINRYTEGIGLNFRGRGYGDVWLYQYPEHSHINLEINALADHASVGVAYLGTRYHISDTIRLTPTSIRLDSLNLLDEEGNHVALDGRIEHDGNFKHFNYRISIAADNALVMNTGVADNDLYYGRLYGTGNVLIVGDDEQTNIYANATTMPNSRFYISTASASTASDNSFVTFVERRRSNGDDDEEDEDDRPRHRFRYIDDISSKLFINLAINITPDALVQIVIDPKTGDVITARGTGDLRLEYPNSSDVRLYGTLTIESGSYAFTFQEVLRREFKIGRGSSLTWSGDPLNAMVDISASYSTSASLSDLDPSLASSVSRATVPVNCVLRLSDRLSSPAIRFDIELPNTEEAIRQQVQNIINTDEMRSRQALYLLVLNKFYTPDYMRVSSGSVNSGDAYSLLSSTLAGQINGLISKLTTDLTLGINMHSTGEGEMNSQEYATNFLYQPNNRLIINGNVGYRNDTYSQSKFIGDIDMEYLLTRNGKLRAKAYTHTVDRYSLKTAQTEQGIGLIYREDFNSAGELFNNLFNLFRKEEKRKSVSP